MFFCCCANDDGQPIEEPNIVALFDGERSENEEHMEVREEEKAKEEKAKLVEPPEDEENKEDEAKPTELPALETRQVEGGGSGVPEQPKSYHYDVEIFKGAAGLGMKMDFKESGLSVSEILSGASVDTYNASASLEQKIQVLDYICAVNGKALSSLDMVAMLKAEKALKLKMFRPGTFDVMIKRNGASLGMDLKFQQDSTSIDVKEVSRGLVQDYNETAPPGMQIMRQDVIKSVNGVCLDTKKMVRELGNAKELNLVMFRGPP
mmetsp:Transcript_87085/g.219262  ORF Transcript_87085/g.219262 Transcript_87085/m.219262 type:complete len:263 (+) Transcript_87085:78-866(+)